VQRDACGRSVDPGTLVAEQLYLAGPRASLLTRTAVKLLNCVTDRIGFDHHRIDLRKPTYADPAQANLAVAADGTLTYTFGAVTDEPAGTYTAGVWVAGIGAAQRLVTADFQVGTAGVEAYASGPADRSTCAACHLGSASGVMNLAHTIPGINPVGYFALDLAPVATCQLCHNNDGYSLQTTVRKVHAVHRGAHQLDAGLDRAEYGAPVDVSLVGYLDVVFPSLPDAEKDCAACHADTTYLSKPSRLACGSCHDNVSFAAGTLSPPRVFGRPAGGACVDDQACATFGAFATCNTGSGSCERTTHPGQADDASCAICHTSGSIGVSPVAARHEIYQRTRVRGLQFTALAVGGASGPGGGFAVGDVPTVSFTLADQSKNPVTDLKTNSTLSFALVVSGPTDAPQRVYAPITTKSSLAGGGSGQYTLTLPAAWAANALSPYNSALPGLPNAPGTYAFYLYVNEALTFSGSSFKDAASSVTYVKFGADQPIRSRQVVASRACNACHGDVQAHGGGRRGVEGCVTCHTGGAVDRSTDRPDQATGAQCIVGTTVCGDFQTCQVTPAGVAPPKAPNTGYCVLAVDPTPGASIELSDMIHRIHDGRRLGGYAERNNLLNPGQLAFVGSANTLISFSDVLAPVDLRNCQNCHVDTGGSCNAVQPCGVGQDCVAGACVNTAWQQPSTRGCLGCHDTAATFGHAALATWTGADGPVETCAVCHDSSATASSSAVHRLGGDPYVPAYQRTP